MKTLEAFRSVADLALPRTCVVCGRDLLLREKHICTTCLEDIPRTHFENMSHNPMADVLNVRLNDGPYVYATALFRYSGAYAQITKSLKFHRNFALGEYFAGMLADNIRLSEHLSDVDLVTCVPLHWTRRLGRGYNQSEVIARRVAGQLDVKYANLLERRRRTARQAGITGENGVERRASNVCGAFALRKDSGKQLKGSRHVLVLDDVFTSGATLSECVKALEMSGTGDMTVSVASLAYAG